MHQNRLYLGQEAINDFWGNQGRGFAWTRQARTGRICTDVEREVGCVKGNKLGGAEEAWLGCGLCCVDKCLL